MNIFTFYRKIKLTPILFIFTFIFINSAFPQFLISQEIDSLNLNITVSEKIMTREIDSLYIKILSPESLKVLKSGLNTLWGFVYGPRLSLLEKNDFSWYSDIDGFLENGRVANIHKLSPGIHRIIFNVQNHSGFTASDTVITVVQSKYIDREPIEVDNLEPFFPEDYEAKGVFGIGMLINEDGGVDSIMVMENTVNDSIIEKIVFDWAEDVNFYPAKENGSSKKTWIVRAFKLPVEKIELASKEKKRQTPRRRGPDLSVENRLRRLREEREKTIKLLGTGEPVAVTGLPEIIVPSYMELSKKKKSLAGLIKACIKVDFAGFVKEILIIENTFKDDWVEKDLIKMLYNTLFKPETEPGGPGIKECYTAFVVEDKKFKEMKNGNFTTWKDEYGIKFANLKRGYEIDFSEAKNDINSAVGVFRMIAEINQDGEVKNIKQIERTINQGSLKNIFVDAYKDDFEYEPAAVNNFPVKSYILPCFSFNNPRFYSLRRILISYNLGYRLYLRGKYNLAISDFRNALRYDSRNDFIGLIPQIIYCYESVGEKNNSKKLSLYEDALWKNAYYRYFDVFKKLVEDYNILKESISKNVLFFSLLPKDRYDLKAIFSFLEQTERAQNNQGPYAVYSELKYPDKARAAGLEGTVDIALLISPSGDYAKIKYARVLKSIGDKKTSKTALKALKTLGFSTAIIESNKIESWISSSVIFSLSDYANRRGGIPQRDQINSKRAVPLKNNEAKYTLQTGLPPMLVNGKSKFSKADDKTSGYIRACVEIDSTGFVTDILILESNFREYRYEAEKEFAEMLTGSVFDPINLKSGPEKQKFLCGFKVFDEFFVEQRNIVFNKWLTENAFRYPYIEEEKLSSDTAASSVDSAILQTAIEESPQDSTKEQLIAAQVKNQKFSMDWSEINAVVEEETNFETEGILEFMFRINTEGNVAVKKGEGFKKFIPSFGFAKSLFKFGYIKSLFGKADTVKNAKDNKGNLADKGRKSDKKDDYLRDDKNDAAKILELKNTLKNAGNLKERIFETILNYKFVPAVSDTNLTDCYVHKRFVFHKKDENEFEKLLKEYNSAYKELLKGNEKNAVKKFEKIARADSEGKYLKIYPIIASYYRENDKVIDALNLYYNEIKRFACLGDFDNMNYLADELILFKNSIWQREDFYSMIQKEKIKKEEMAKIKAEKISESAELVYSSNENRNQDTTKISADQSREIVDTLAHTPDTKKQKDSLTVQESTDSLSIAFDMQVQEIKEYDEKELLYILPEEKRPKLIGSIDSIYQAIKYPELKDGKIVKGTVVIAVLVDKEGKVKEAEIKESIRNKKFDEAALKTAKKLKFEPAIYNYEPIEHWYILLLEFDSAKMEIFSKSEE